MALSNAAAMVLVNAGEDREELFRVSATLGGRSGGEEEPKGPEKMATVRHTRRNVRTMFWGKGQWRREWRIVLIIIIRHWSWLLDGNIFVFLSVASSSDSSSAEGHRIH